MARTTKPASTGRRTGPKAAKPPADDTASVTGEDALAETGTVDTTPGDELGTPVPSADPEDSPTPTGPLARDRVDPTPDPEPERSAADAEPQDPTPDPGPVPADADADDDDINPAPSGVAFTDLSLDAEEERAVEGPGPVPTPVPAAPPPQQVTVQKVGFLPLAAGGAVAALAGLVAGWTLWGDTAAPDLSAIETQGARIDEIGARLDSLPAAPSAEDLRTAMQSDLDTIAAEIDSLREEVATLTGTQAEIDGRLAAVERAPNEDGTLADEALAAFDGDFEDLRARIAALSERIDTATAETQAALAAREEELAAAEAAAEAEAGRMALRGTLADLRGALDTGAPYPETLAALQEAGDVPAPIAEAASEGAPTLARLQASFPDAAREALAAARAAGLGGETSGGVSGFFRSTFNVRSTTAREGDTVDAILSRAEAALAAGDLSGAVTEVQTLPEEAARPLADWTAAAQRRLDALAALDGLSQTLTEN